jgi:hypothetical protein
MVCPASRARRGSKVQLAVEHFRGTLSAESGDTIVLGAIVHHELAAVFVAVLDGFHSNGEVRHFVRPRKPGGFVQHGVALLLDKVRAADDCLLHQVSPLSPRRLWSFKRLATVSRKGFLKRFA